MYNWRVDDQLPVPVQRSTPKTCVTDVPKEVAHGRAISYQRVSTQGQATDDKNSFGRQQEAFDAWCAAHPNHPPLTTYRVARSGAEANRFEWLFSGIQSGDFVSGDVVVVESINRFSREEMSEALTGLLEIWNAGIRTAFCEFQGGIILDKPYFNQNTYLIHGLAGQIDAARKLYEDRKYWSNDNVNKNHRAIYEGRLNDSHFKERSQREDGTQKRVLYKFWLDFKRDLNNGRGGFVLNSEARWIQRMFELGLSMGQELIADTLYEEGFRGIGGKFVTGKTIGQYLTDRSVVGEWFPTTIEKDSNTGRRKINQVGPVKRDLFPPAVHEELFNKVNELRVKRRTNETYNNGGGSLQHLFGGACYCDECGGLIDRYKQKEGFKPMLRCRNRQCSARRGIHYEEAELLNQLQGFRWNQFFRDDCKGELLTQLNQQVLEAQEELNKANEKAEKIKAAQDDFIEQGRSWPRRLDELLEEQEQVVQAAESALNKQKAALRSAGQTPTGEAAVKATQQRIAGFIKQSNELEARREFNNWFVSSGLVLVVDLKRRRAEFGRGEVQVERRKKTLLGVSFLEEDAAAMGASEQQLQQLGRQIEHSNIRRAVQRKKAQQLLDDHKRDAIHVNFERRAELETKLDEANKLLEKQYHQRWQAGELQSEWPQPDKAWEHVDRLPLTHILKVRSEEAKAASRKSKRPHSLSSTGAVVINGKRHTTARVKSAME